MSSDSFREPSPRESVQDAVHPPRPAPTTPSRAAASAFPAVVIAIDGPAGSGKTTLATAVAARLGAKSLHTGRHYRSVTLAALRNAVPAEHGAAVLAMYDGLAPSLDEAGDLQLRGSVYRPAELETAEVDAAVSTVAGHEQLRDRLIAIQRDWVAAAVRDNRSVVIEGRDSGTRIAPHTPFRFYLLASAEERGTRREQQRGVEHPMAIVSRDRADEGLGRTTPSSPGVTVITCDGVREADLLARLWRELPVEIARQWPFSETPSPE